MLLDYYDDISSLRKPGISSTPFNSPEYYEYLVRKFCLKKLGISRYCMYYLGEKSGLLIFVESFSIYLQNKNLDPPKTYPLNIKIILYE